jgi:hypothetical protein
VGFLTNGDELRLLLSDPARPASFVSFRLSAWRNLSPREVPDGFRLLRAFLDPNLLTRQGEDREKPSKLEALLDAARLKQGQITKDLRLQARRAVEQFIQGVLDHPANREQFLALGGEERNRLPRQLWREALILVYRLLFILRGEASGAFRFSTTSPWRHTYSPGYALAEVARQVIDRGAATGTYLEQGLRKLFEIFEKGLRWTEANIAPLGGRLFGQQETPILSSTCWSEVGCAGMLDMLLWTLEKPKGARRTQAETGRRRINYADLDVEDLGRVYEALLELEPGLATEPMVRLRRAKLEVIVPDAQGTRYRPTRPSESGDTDADDTDDEEGADADDGEEEGKGKKSKVEFVEEIIPEAGSPGRFFLRVGLGRKASGSYYTPDSFVRFLVQETLRPQVEERSPVNDPQPEEILKLKVLDPAMGSGHFLVGACRYLGERLYEACRLCADKGLWDRVPAELAPYLPGRVQEGEAEVGVSAERARAICKRLVAVHCLYGVDKNELAVELAKVCLWLESQAEGMPLTFLDHRLVHGDSLTGPFWHHLITYPIDGEPIEGLFAQGVQEKFSKRLAGVLTKVKWLEQTVGATPDEIAEKQKLKAEIDAELFPFRVLALSWSGAVMLGERKADNQGYGHLVKHVAENGELAETMEPWVLAMLRRGVGVASLPPARQELHQALSSSLGGGTSGPALAYDLAFPEVFYPTGVLSGRQGFHAVLGNPPWDALQPLAKEFYAGYDLDILNAPTRREREAVEKRLGADPNVQVAYEEYVAGFEELKGLIDRLYQRVNKSAGGSPSGAMTDLWQVFAERGIRLLRQAGRVGWVLPSAFHANQSATGIRELYLTENALERCYSFENRRKLFDIHRSFKFANVVARRDGAGAKEFSAAFYLHDDEWLHGEQKARQPFQYSKDFIRQTGGEYYSFLELRSRKALEVAEVCFAHGEPFGHVCERLGIRFGDECHMAKDAWRFTPTSQLLSNGEDPRDPEVARKALTLGYLVLHEGKTFRQYHDRWGERTRYLVATQSLADRAGILKQAQFYRLGYRDIAGPGDQNVSIFNLHPPGITTGDTAPVERSANARPDSAALFVLATLNSFSFDWLLQLRVRSHLNAFMLQGTPFPTYHNQGPLLAHSALRLTCNHSGYAPLRREQFGDTWREPKPPFTWPVLATDDERWEIRAAIDATVADAYGLNSEQYALILSTFSHKSYPQAPALCLAKFDELKQIGLDAFTRKYDPYWDIPLNESLPKPVIEFNSVDDSAARPDESAFRLTGDPPPKGRSRRRRK